jgi:hypothetical protein
MQQVLNWEFQRPAYVSSGPSSIAVGPLMARADRRQEGQLHRHFCNSFFMRLTTAHPSTAPLHSMRPSPGREGAMLKKGCGLSCSKHTLSILHNSG